jgi:hypothetical protein
MLSSQKYLMHGSESICLLSDRSVLKTGGWMKTDNAGTLEICTCVNTVLTQASEFFLRDTGYLSTKKWGNAEALSGWVNHLSKTLYREPSRRRTTSSFAGCGGM